jgi:hypothetical protein
VGRAADHLRDEAQGVVGAVMAGAILYYGAVVLAMLAGSCWLAIGTGRMIRRQRGDDE